jgi:hypothetical protein
VTKLQVPVMYAIFVLDLKLLEWKTVETQPVVAAAVTSER